MLSKALRCCKQNSPWPTRPAQRPWAAAASWPTMGPPARAAAELSTQAAVWPSLHQHQVPLLHQTSANPISHQENPFVSGDNHGSIAWIRQVRCVWAARTSSGCWTHSSPSPPRQSTSPWTPSTSSTQISRLRTIQAADDGPPQAERGWQDGGTGDQKIQWGVYRLARSLNGPSAPATSTWSSSPHTPKPWTHNFWRSNLWRPSLWKPSYRS